MSYVINTQDQVGSVGIGAFSCGENRWRVLIDNSSHGVLVDEESSVGNTGANKQRSSVGPSFSQGLSTAGILCSSRSTQVVRLCNKG